MLRALLDGDRVDALSVRRRSDEEERLRRAARDDRLICPGCHDLVDFTYGTKNRPYFRHQKGQGKGCVYKQYLDRRQDLEDLKWSLADRFKSLGREVIVEERMTEDHWTDLIVVWPDGRKLAIDLTNVFRNSDTRKDTAEKYTKLRELYREKGMGSTVLLRSDASSGEGSRSRNIDGLRGYMSGLGRPAVTYDSEARRFVIYDGSSEPVSLKIDDLDLDPDGNVVGRYREILGERELREAERRAAAELAEAERRAAEEELERQRTERREAERQKKQRLYEDSVRARTEAEARKRKEAERARTEERQARRKRLKEEHERRAKGLTLVQTALDKYFSRMNDRQREAVFAIEGPVLVLAGAGSGKTTVLVDRIANMILFGKGWNKPDDMLTEEERGFLECYDGDHDPFEVDILRDIVAIDPVKPWSILAITFTNKAAGELKSRLSSMLGADGELVRASTFHSACVRILRREITALGYTQGFTIYDTDDTKRLIKDCVKTLDLEPKRFPERIVMAHISDAKNDLIDADSYAAKAGSDYFTMTVAQIYKLYQERLKASDALDFDDIIMLTVKLFSEHPEVLDHYQNLYRYIMVDEYQDTNHAQYVLVSLLAEKYGNLCVVGDDDQSIYSFRGATIRNILSFEDQFSDCVTIKLEQNYRSTQNILDAANAVIGNNSGRRPKALWTERDGGELITVYCADDERAEAKYVTDTIEDMVSKGRDYSDFAVLYRMNAQSNSIEHAFRVSKIPYRIIGGLRFYDRREIKDILAYMSVLADPHDMVRFKRIVNLPKRGIGETTAASIEEISYVVGDDPIRIMADADGYAPLVRKASLLKKTAAMFEALREDAEEMRPDELIDRIMAVTGYGEMLKEEGDEGITRFENIAELKSNIQLYTDHCEDTGSEPTLAGFLEEAALYSSADDADDDQPSVNMMTIHSAKGLEFPVVFLVGAEENIFPSQRARADTLQLEEERRLAYVAITRAKDKLFITHARTRLLMGMTHYDPRTRFIREIGPDLLEELPPPFKDPRPASSAGDGHIPGMHTIQGMRKRPAAGEDTYIVADFTVGERVVHPKFGGGTILTVKPIGDDQMVDVAFDTIGTKKIMVRFARLRRE